MKEITAEPRFGLGLTESELVFRESQVSLNKRLTGFGNANLASHLAQIIQKHPELASFIQAWPELSVGLRQAIIKMMR